MTGLTLGEQRSTQVADLVANFSERLTQERDAEQPKQFSKRQKK